MTNTIAYILSFLVSLLLANGLVAQTVSVSGTIVDESGAPIPGATVQVSGTYTGDITDEKGQYTITGLQSGSIILQISCVAFQSLEIKVDVGKEPITQNIILEEGVVDLDAVTVTGKSIVQEVREKAYNVEVVNAKALHTTSLDLAHALDRSSGVR
ncbi:MAG: carboxypeptidase-like regulatory domain-containing protein, partial [Cyclobacteriaceae bacterium]|nr:carboxypeptidase-like regulatory domain-containing protein [Cyclobacteriaceae bacterium SS2]